MNKVATNFVKIKTLSVNKAWQGRRFKSKDYKKYERELFSILPPIECKLDEPLSIYLEIGFSNKANDIDNPIKPLLDIFQKKYKFNDSLIYSLHIEKKVVKKDEEYFKFRIWSNCV